MVLVFAEREGNSFKKSAYEAVSYGRDLAESLGTTCVAAVIGRVENAGQLGRYGAHAVVEHTGAGTDVFEPAVYTAALDEIAKSQNCDVVVLSGSYTGKILAPKLAARNKAALVTGVVELPDMSSGFTVRKSCYSNKAFTTVQLNAPNKVLSIIPNSYSIKEFPGEATLTQLSTDLSGSSMTQSLEIDKQAGKVPLTEAEVVVSGGRGLKGPENWGMIEEMAELLGAATACSKPVSDMEWRPHSEHVGQTGITIKPNLYIAIGISGAIQHLAGVGGSKVICVINTDPEAPFFKAADYGIVGDAFDVVPKLINRLKEINA
ncbi:MAG: electron transfer flavoprotein subunit alpha/FixB family protein [Flavobacteriales bacterium]|nr:electron transfer flavoprotein subunit alpha/FixB family protein [Flavobacteriales bacterium]